MAKSLEKLEAEAQQVEERIKALRKQIREEKKAQRNKLERALGAKVLAETGVQSVSAFEEKFLITAKDVAQSSDVSELQADAKMAKQLMADLQIIADGMKWDGHVWQIENSRKVTDWLANFRSENSEEKG